MNLLNKDYDDVGHDRKNDTLTPVIIPLIKGIDLAEFGRIMKEHSEIGSMIFKKPAQLHLKGICRKVL